MPCRLNHRVHIELEYHICAIFSWEDVQCAHIKDIIEEPHLFDIWCTLPLDMMTLMHHVVSALMLIWSLRADTQTKSSPHLSEVSGYAHLDSSSYHA